MSTDNQDPLDRSPERQLLWRRHTNTERRFWLNVWYVLMTQQSPVAAHSTVVAGQYKRGRLTLHSTHIVSQKDVKSNFDNFIHYICVDTFQHNWLLIIFSWFVKDLDTKNVTIKHSQLLQWLFFRLLLELSRII